MPGTAFESAAAQKNEGRDFRGLDDVAALARLFKPLGCRLFGLLGFVLVFRHGL